MLKEHLLLGGLWILFGVIHSVLASVGLKLKVQTSLPQVFSVYRLLYNIVAFASFAAVIGFQFTITSVTLFEKTRLSIIAGSIIAITGLLLMAACIKKYFIGLSGLRSLWKENSTDELHISGVHRFVRHPLYLGTFVFIWGLLIIFPTLSLLISNTVITIYTLIGIGFEERKLVRLFGDSYTTYRRSVPMLIPQWPKKENITTAKRTGLADT
jgi:protein-S-isoprenylcysteine O-methyltransferase Ste14